MDKKNYVSQELDEITSLRVFSGDEKMNLTFGLRIGVCAALLPFSLVGCGNSLAPSNRSEVKGFVSLDGQPLAGAEVKLISDKSTGFATTNDAGQFQLVQAVHPGSYRVVISKLEGLASQAQQQTLPAEQGLDAGQLDAIAMTRKANPQMGAAPTRPKELIPPSFSDLQLTQLSVDVPRGGLPNADFKLTSR